MMQKTSLMNLKIAMSADTRIRRPSPTKSWKNVTTFRSSQRPISIMKSLPVICSCVIIILITDLFFKGKNELRE